MTYKIRCMDSIEYLKEYDKTDFDLTFLDPPFNQGKTYRAHNDNMPINEYWKWMENVSRLVYQKSSDGAGIYFMQREKNVREVLNILHDTKWKFRNLITWKKKTSAVPVKNGYGKHYQIIAFATKGNKPRVFNKLRIDPPLLQTEKYKRPNGVFVTDVWDDIRELTSGFFAGDEPIRDNEGKRVHHQQAPIRLLARIILSSTNVGDKILDPFAGTGTTLIVAEQLKRNSIGIDNDSKNIKIIMDRMKLKRDSDILSNIKEEYKYTENFDIISGL